MNATTDERMKGNVESGRRAAVTPDWREYKAPGMGRM
jgi:hypothetical protein